MGNRKVTLFVEFLYFDSIYLLFLGFCLHICVLIDIYSSELAIAIKYLFDRLCVFANFPMFRLRLVFLHLLTSRVFENSFLLFSFFFFCRIPILPRKTGKNHSPIFVVLLQFVKLIISN